MIRMAPGWWNKPWPLGVLLFGLPMLVLAVIGTFTGKTYGRGGTYWLTLVIQYLGAAFLIWYGLYGLPHALESQQNSN